MARSYSRGHEIYFDKSDGIWRYSDNNEPVNETRTCKQCGKPPTKEGYDACLGYIPGAKAACCGHGIEKTYVKMKENENE